MNGSESILEIWTTRNFSWNAGLRDILVGTEGATGVRLKVRTNSRVKVPIGQ